VQVRGPIAGRPSGFLARLSVIRPSALPSWSGSGRDGSPGKGTLGILQSQDNTWVMTVDIVACGSDIRGGCQMVVSCAFRAGLVTCGVLAAGSWHAAAAAWVVMRAGGCCLRGGLVYGGWVAVMGAVSDLRRRCRVFGGSPPAAP
jgi:hypothetical protein